MHEMSITQSVLAIALDEASRHNARRIRSITLLIGQYSGVVPACVQEYFAIASRGTIAEDAVLNIQTPAPRVACRVCGFEGETKPFYALCPACQSSDIRLLSGTEYLVESLEVE